MGVVEKEVDDCIALLGPSEEVFVLNETASDVWRLVDSALTLETIVKRLAQAYGVDPRSIWDDVARTVEFLEAHELLHISP